MYGKGLRGAAKGQRTLHSSVHSPGIICCCCVINAGAKAGGSPLALPAISRGHMDRHQPQALQSAGKAALGSLGVHVCVFTRA